MGSQARLANTGGGDGFTTDWTDEITEKPMLISDYPENSSFYDYYFNVEGSGWSKFNLEVELSEAKLAFNDQMDNQKRMYNFYCPTYDSLRYHFLCEAFVTNQVSTLVIGNAGAGSSVFLKELLFK